jgi:outer membrane protein OmpA-like peptidoglycan-associated protein
LEGRRENGIVRINFKKGACNGTGKKERSPHMNRQRSLLALALLILISVAPGVRAQQRYTVSEGYPFLGVDLGVAEPTNDNFRAHVVTGASGSPFGGYMFNDWLGLQSNLDFNFFPPDNDHMNGTCFNGLCQLPKSQPVPAGDLKNVGQINHQNGYTTMLGLTVGPRVQIPLGDLVDLYTTAQGGGFKAMGGRLNQWAPGLSVGGGLDVNLTQNLSVGLFGRWNRAYMSPHPTTLVRQVSDENGPADAQWASAGVSMKWSFKQAAPPPPPPPVAQAPPPPPPPTKEKIVLRGVHFDFDKSNIRPDARVILDEAVRILKERADIAIAIEGHTDAVGSDAYNMKLSNRRAQAVKTYLVDHGIAAKRIVSVEGFGKRQPVASNDTAEGRAQNRRVELHVK